MRTLGKALLRLFSSPPLVRVPDIDPRRGLEMKFRSESPATFVSLLSWGENMMLKSNPLVVILKKGESWLFEGFSVRPSRADRVVDTSGGQPARRRWEDETMAISCKTMHLVAV